MPLNKTCTMTKYGETFYARHTRQFHIQWCVRKLLDAQFCSFVFYSTRRCFFCLTLGHFVLVFSSPFSIAITSLWEERATLSAFRMFVRFVLVWICRFPLPLGVWEGLQFVIVALPGLFSYLFLTLIRFCVLQHIIWGLHVLLRPDCPTTLGYYVMNHNVRKRTLRYAPNEDSDQPVHLRSVFRIFTVHIFNSQGCKVSSCGQKRLIGLLGCANSSTCCAHIRRYVF